MSKLIFEDVPLEKQSDLTIEFDVCDFNEKDLVAIDITNFRMSSEGSQGLITIDGFPSNKYAVYGLDVTKSVLLKMVRDRVAMSCNRSEDSEADTVHGMPLEQTKKDHVDEELLIDAEPAVSKSLVELMQKRGYVKGAILVISGGYDPVPEVSYGILADIWEDDNHKTLYIRLTDERIVEAVDCQIATDVNKHIIRMVEAEKGRMIENAIKFGEKIDNYLEQIIFE